MGKLRNLTGLKPKARIIGDRTFAAITAVEGIRLSGESRKRLAALKRDRHAVDGPQSAELLDQIMCLDQRRPGRAGRSIRGTGALHPVFLLEIFDR